MFSLLRPLLQPLTIAKTNKFELSIHMEGKFVGTIKIYCKVRCEYLISSANQRKVWCLLSINS